jgi:NAD(P)-dependent dehydrogenase (short-subunit alcohol dehydrogenase family)
MNDALFSLSGKTAIVTGACGLLGRQHCEALADAGANVVAADLDADTVSSFAAELERGHDRKMLGIRLDVTSRDSILSARTATLRKFHGIDILVNNAAINDMFENPQAAADLSRFENYPLHLWEQSLQVNLTGAFLCAQIFGESMVTTGSGSIINIASTYGIVAPDQRLYKKPDGSQSFYKTPAYPVTKAGILALTRFLAAYWGSAGIRVNALSPGGVENNQDEWFVDAYASRTPLGRMASPRDYRGALVFLAASASAYMTGANLVVDGGWTIW